MATPWVLGRCPPAPCKGKSLEYMLLYNQFFFVLLQLYGSLDTQRYVVLPYERNSGNMTLIKENDLSEKYPMTYSYLKNVKRFLEEEKKVVLILIMNGFN